MPDEIQFENTVERLLAEASKSAAARPAFYRELLHSQVLLVPHGPIEEGADDSKRTLRMAAIPIGGVPHVPFFLAPKFVPADQRYVGLPARTFFEITKGSHLVLNPGAQFGRRFAPHEVEQLLSGKMLDVEKEFQLSNGAVLGLGPPPTIPPGLLEQLTKFFDTEPTVLRAWLGWYQPEQETQPGYMLALETVRSAGFRELAGRATVVLRDVGTAGTYCDIGRYDGSALMQRFDSLDAFYSKPFWERLKRSIFG